jgi:hypothetical protein
MSKRLSPERTVSVNPLVSGFPNFSGITVGAFVGAAGLPEGFAALEALTGPANSGSSTALTRITEAPALDLDAYAAEVIRWVRGPTPEDKVRPDLADLLEAERVEMRREGLLRMPGEGVEARHPNSVPPGVPGRQP